MTTVRAADSLRMIHDVDCIYVAIRRRRPGEIDDSPQKRQPVPQVHVDQTKASATARVHRHLPVSDAPELLKHRFQIINLWRPINHPLPKPCDMQPTPYYFVILAITYLLVAVPLRLWKRRYAIRKIRGPPCHSFLLGLLRVTQLSKLYSK